ncbi:MAG: endolytic transglycosylase MltG [Cyclobacteriaceae bacterium]|nr:endolytic transglycosylase MltG [Cyclobacteriaceae bacterium]
MQRKRIMVIVFLVVTIFLISFTFYVYQMIYTPNFLVGQDFDSHLLIPEEATFKQVQDSLYDGRLVHDLVAFSVMAKITNTDKRIRPGRYKIATNSSNLDVIRILRNGTQEPVRVTFNNVRSDEDMARRLTRNLAITADELLEEMHASSTHEKYGRDSANMRHIFIPNTYEVFWDVSASELIARMNREYESFWNEKRRAQAEAIGLTPDEVMVLASIVEAETTKIDEASTIAGVYLNRLRIGMALQADPTVIYGLGDFEITRVRSKHTAIDTPYNTYMYPGLPPGAIRYAAIPYIEATLSPEEHKYLYFCAKDDFSGYHAFASNFADHQRNARLYQRALNQANIR